MNSFLPYIALFYTMLWSVEISYWLTLGLAVFAAGFMARIFMIQHDCGHGSFFKSRRANNIVGYIAGVLTFTPYHYWRHRHAIHHATVGNLDRRGVGDIWTMTLQEYRNASTWQRLKFRLYRNPFVLFLLGAPFLFLVYQRFVHPKSEWRWHRSVFLSNVVIAGTAVAMGLLFGFQTYALVQLPIIVLAAIAGLWLFYVQHQFEGVRWVRHPEWDPFMSAIEGSSFYKLPVVLQWFSGNIGFHHIHHLSPRIPNYFLAKCHSDNPMFHGVKTLRFWGSMKTIRYRLWDEEQRQLIPAGPFWL